MERRETGLVLVRCGALISVNTYFLFLFVEEGGCKAQVTDQRKTFSRILSRTRWIRMSVPKKENVRTTLLVYKGKKSPRYKLQMELLIRYKCKII